MQNSRTPKTSEPNENSSSASPHVNTHHHQPSTKLQIDTLESMILLSGSSYAGSSNTLADDVADQNPETPYLDIASSPSSSDSPLLSTVRSPLVDQGCGYPKPPVVQPPNTTPPAVDNFDSILEWNDVMLQANAADHSRAAPEQGGPILTSRAFALVSAAMYDAYNSIENIGAAYLVDAPYTKGANSDAAVAEAAYQALIKLYPSQKALFDAELNQSLARIADGASEDLGRSIGLHVAEKTLATREQDGYEKLSSDVYKPNGKPGFHNVDPLHPNQGFYGAGAFEIDPFAVENADQFKSAPLDDGTPEGRLAFMKSDRYLKAFEEVKSLGGDGIQTPTSRTAEQTEIGIYWGYDGRPEIGTPPRLYNQIVREIAADQNNTEAENARLFALVNISMADAGVTSWNSKYDDSLWRPILGIRGGDVDGNPDTVGDINFTPLGAPASNPRRGETNFTPNFPAYTSGHATFGAAMFQTLARFYGTDDIKFSFVSDEFDGRTIDANGSVRPSIERTFDSLTQAKVENAQSRIYLGIHWAFDASDGIKMGDAIADYVFDNILESNSNSNGKTRSLQLV